MTRKARDKAPSEVTEAVLKKAQKRNNTGVYKNFACGACRVNVPQDREELAATQNWKLYKANEGLYVAVHNISHLAPEISSIITRKKVDYGVMALFDLKEDAMNTQDKRDAFLKIIESKNNNPGKLRTSFQFPDEGDRINYDTLADESEWVIKEVANPLHPNLKKSLNRD